MLDTIDSLSGDRLELTPYLDDFDGRVSSLRNTDIWKLERQQDFDQPESASWLAFREGRRAESLELIEKKRSSLRAEFDELARAGCALRRVRVVEKPFTTYLLWELHSLHLRAQCGEDIRIITPEPLAKWEHQAQVPEIVGLGDEVTYKILYDHQGVLQGGVRFTDHALTTRCRAEVAALHEMGEDLTRYFPREVEGAALRRD
ncbi:DUF6879 family protein [Nocardiopsis sp. NPDC006938]|uniref:DUF6879 family protein n=1 Tax=Nocardiopsis sp. NPDC006938 TaxID=3364337 RepID=UPI0036B958EA